MSDAVETLLDEGMRKLGLSLAPEPFFEYLRLLNKWNHAYNLTAVRDIASMVPRHLLDSLAVLPWIKGSRLLDVGSGAGLPGIPLALALPELHVVLVDSNGKKTRFLNEVKRALSLNNVEVVQTRIENYHPSQGFDTVTSRAFSELGQMIQWTKHTIAPGGIWLAMKGRFPETELASVEYPYRVEAYTVAGIDVERCCVIVDHVKA